MSSYEKVTQPEAYPLKRTTHCPNNDLPVLIYRNVLQPLNEESASEILQRHGWEKKGTWGTISLKHFHPNTHECYGKSISSAETFISINL
ncbi:cupin domain protein [Colletotrichum scovillei]|uniref:Cupin domain protein n=1 Tax=Colletotrichum scovillei TaxID=1209932 RepID=A0A9P7U7J5_9PEZI|nr:cupin domain protein [Colletotrichum scovillei]KAG7043243.1 cupin domain protein [Colletotrichum scovillei]KAG7062690.1 cupin domain protein [Colletotrichum scovillei]